MKCLSDVNYHVKEVTTGKAQVVHYDRMKRYDGPITIASNVQTRRTSQIPGYQLHSVPDFDHSQCVQSFLLFTFALHMTSPIPVNHPSSLPNLSSASVLDVFPNRTPPATPPSLLSSARRCSLPSLTRSIDHERRSSPVLHHPFRWSPALVHLLQNFSLPANLLKKQLSFGLPHGWIRSSMVLLTISVSHPLVHHSRKLLQHFAILGRSYLTFTLLLP